MKILEENIPARIVLSRKGSDSKYGGKSSLRIETTLVSLPIPEYLKCATERCKGHVSYRDLAEQPPIGSLADHLSAWVTRDSEVHLDPDIRPQLRRPGDNCQWLLFGQEGAAQAHLQNQQIGNNSLFLFFGWFQECEYRREKLKRIGPDEHVIWGWFQVRDSFPVNSDAEAENVSWAKHHPHVSHWRRYAGQNRLYRANDRLSFAPSVKGAGVFRWRPELTLTRQCQTRRSRTHWCVPSLFATTGLSYNEVGNTRCPDHPERVHFQSACIGQEFVFPDRRDMEVTERVAVAEWLAQLFEGVDA